VSAGAGNGIAPTQRMLSSTKFVAWPLVILFLLDVVDAGSALSSTGVGVSPRSNLTASPSMVENITIINSTIS